MAIWQYSIFILPREAIVEHYGVIPPSIDEDFLFAFTGWDKLDLVTRFFNDNMKPGATGIHGWGDVEGFDGGPRISTDKRTLRGVGFRLDVTKDLSNQIKVVLDLVNLVDGVIIDSLDYFTILPTPEGLRWAIMRSDSARFVTDPHKFLSDLSKKNKE